MPLYTQISGHTSDAVLDQIVAAFLEHDIRVYHSMNDDWIITDESCPMVDYQEAFSFFESIATSSFHIVENDSGTVANEHALPITYAMSKQKPIIFTRPPVLSKRMNRTLHDIIAKRMKDMAVAPLHLEDISSFITALKSLPMEIDYKLTEAEKQMVRHYHELHFSRLLRRKPSAAYA